MDRLVIQARIVTMGAQGVLPHGWLYIEGPHIRAVQAAETPVPAGFAGAPRLVLPDCDVLPGLLDLHNHAPYNAFPLWQVPRRFKGRSGWLGHADYARQVREPADKLEKKSAPVHHALARYVEIRSLLGGATTLQGLSSKDDAKPYHGLVRNLEHPALGSGLPGAGVQVMDIRTDGVEAFRKKLKEPRPLLFHLSEGKDAKALGQAALVREEGLLHHNLVCIHCLGLTQADHQALHAAEGHVVWSPFSNLLLYGETLDVAMLAAPNIPFALACDWTPSGSRNLLQELKVAWLVDQQQPAGARLGAKRLAQAVTVDAARVVQSGSRLGVIAKDLFADLLVLKRRRDDAFENLLAATEREVQLVLVDGHALYGDQTLMKKLHGSGVPLEALRVGGARKALHLPEGPSLAACTALLRAELADLASSGPVAPFGVPALDGADAGFRLHFDMDDGGDAPQLGAMNLAPSLNSVPLAPLTVVDDLALFDTIDAIDHLPAYLKGAALRDFYVQ